MLVSRGSVLDMNSDRKPYHHALKGGEVPERSDDAARERLIGRSATLDGLVGQL